MLIITPLYAASLTLIFICLSIRTLRQRRLSQVALGNGNDDELLRRARVHANFSEYVPIALIMATFVEMQSAHWFVVNLVCFCLLFGRVLHAFGVSQANENFKYRVIGMALTFTSLAFSSFTIIALFVMNTITQ